MRLNKLLGQAAVAMLLLGSLTQAALAAPMKLTLEDSVSIAIKNSARIKTAEAEKEKAIWSFKEAKGKKGFSLTYSGVVSRTDDPPSWVPSTTVVDPYNYYSHKLTLALPLYTGGQLENAIEAQKRGAYVAGWSLGTTKQQIKLEASVAFYQVLEAKDYAKIARESVEALTVHLKNTEKEFDVGVVPKADVLRSKVQLANAQTNLIKIENAYELALLNLNHVMGQPLQTEVVLNAELKQDPYPLTMDACIDYALMNRLELKQVQTMVAIAQDKINIAKGEKLPAVSLLGMNQWEDTNNSGTNSKNWTVALMSQWNLFDSGVTDSKVAGAKQAKIAATEQAKDTEDKIVLEVSQAYLNLKEAKKRIDTTRVAVEEAQTDFDMAQKRYFNGAGINLDVIDAEVALNTAKTNYVKALYDYNVSRARLDKATGEKAE
jgi:outer membrane protein